MTKPPFKWDDLRLLLAVARCGQLTSAGKRLGLDAATLSRRLNALESSLQQELFHKSPRGYTLTAAGELLLPHAQSMESAALSAEQSLNPNGAGFKRSVRIGAPDGVATTLLAPCCANLCEIDPSLSLEVVATARHFSLSQREADMAITVDAPRRGRLRSRRLGDYFLRPYASTALLENHPLPRKMSDLQYFVGIGYVPDVLFAPALDYNAQLNPPLQARLCSSNLIVQLNWTLAGAGVCVLPDFLARQHSQLVPLLQSQVEFKRSLYLVRHADDDRFNDIASALVKDIRARLATLHI